MSERTLLELAGGLEGLRAVVETFYAAVLDDVMIGFFFRGTDRARLVEKETELAARALGARDVQYTGRPIREAHARHPIMGGHFDRRLKLLRDAMAAHGLPQAVVDAWVAHTQALRPLVTPETGSDCDHRSVADRAVTD